MKPAVLRLCALLACSFMLPVLAKAQTRASTQDPLHFAPIEGALDKLEELRPVIRRTGGGKYAYAIDVTGLSRLYPAAVTGEGATLQVDQAAISALLLAMAKDLQDQNHHLNIQLAHLMNDKADLERKMHELSSRIEALELSTATAAGATPPSVRVSARQ